jgi:hypothetical protein
MGVNATRSINGNRHKDTQLDIVMLSVAFFVVMLNVVMLSDSFIHGIPGIIIHNINMTQHA